MPDAVCRVRSPADQQHHGGAERHHSQNTNRVIESPAKARRWRRRRRPWRRRARSCSRWPSANRPPANAMIAKMIANRRPSASPSTGDQVRGRTKPKLSAAPSGSARPCQSSTSGAGPTTARAQGVARAAAGAGRRAMSTRPGGRRRSSGYQAALQRQPSRDAPVVVSPSPRLSASRGLGEEHHADAGGEEAVPGVRSRSTPSMPKCADGWWMNAARQQHSVSTEAEDPTTAVEDGGSGRRSQWGAVSADVVFGSGPNLSWSATKHRAARPAGMAGNIEQNSTMQPPPSSRGHSDQRCRPGASPGGASLTPSIPG